MTATPQTVAKRRQSVLDAIADETLAQQADAEEARQDAVRAEEEATERRAQALAQAREAADAWTASCTMIVEGVDLLVEGLKQQAEAGSSLARFPGSTPVVSRAAAHRRLGDFLSRRLFGVVRSNNFGRVVLNSGGNSVVGDFVAAERKVLSRLFEPPEPEEPDFTNGEDRHD